MRRRLSEQDQDRLDVEWSRVERAALVMCDQVIKGKIKEMRATKPRFTPTMVSGLHLDLTIEGIES